MDQKQLTKTITTDMVNEIAYLEAEIASILSPYALDYIEILSPNNTNNIQLSKPLTAAQITLLTKYNDMAKSVLKIFEVEVELTNKELFNKFLEYSRMIYLVRYIETRKLFASYSLFSIPTIESHQIAQSLNPEKEPIISLEIKADEIFVLKESGELDFDKTVKKEEETNLIKRILSSISNYHELAGKAMFDLSNITTRAFLVSMNKDLLYELFQNIFQNLIIEINKSVYDYIDRGYTTLESRNNVIEFLKKSTAKSGTKLPKMLDKSQKEIEEILNININEQLKINDNKIKAELIDEIMQLVVHYCSLGYFVPENFYKLKFIEHTDLPIAYENYHHVVEIYLLDDYNQTSEYASEAYDIDFSRDFKKTLFELVTNGNINPLLTLEDFMNRV